MSPSPGGIYERASHTDQCALRAGAVGARGPKSDRGHGHPGGSNTPTRRNPPTFQGSPKGDVQGQRRYRTPPTRRGRAPSLLAGENKFVRGTYFPHSPRDQLRAQSTGVCRGAGDGEAESGEYDIRSDFTSVFEWLLARNSVYVLTVCHAHTHTPCTHARISAFPRSEAGG